MWRTWPTGYRVLWLDFSSLKDIYLLLSIINTNDNQSGNLDFNRWKNKLLKPNSPNNGAILAEVQKIANTKHTQWHYRNVPVQANKPEILPKFGDVYSIYVDNMSNKRYKDKIYGQLYIMIMQKTFTLGFQGSLEIIKDW